MVESSFVIEVSGLHNQFNEQVIHHDLYFNVLKGEICAVVGGSGAGKTTLLHSILQLLKPQKGIVKVFNQDVFKCNTIEMRKLRSRWGVLFQHGALYSSLSVLENICFPLKEFTNLNEEAQKELALLRLSQVGLNVDTAWKKPSELSGGMLKRVALARAIILEPELIFLDEPTTGLDPKSAESLEELIKDLHESLKSTMLIITHDLDTLWRVPDRVAFLGEEKVITTLPMADLVKSKYQIISDYFSGERSQQRIKFYNKL